jgi:hypothetical protein
MYIGGSIALIAFGAILRFAVADTLEGINLGTIGVILMVVGALGLVISLIQTAMYRDGMRGSRSVTTVDRDGRYVP